ncbi:MAG: acyl-CoA dehydrogenase, partial [Pseudonocardiaceae bacterium]|nr:acyl-CoA dehydrogenase [Pseudonocardiaceae bacterium]
MTIDFTLSDSQQELQKNAQQFAEGVLRPVAEKIDQAADGWEAFLAGREAYREMAHAGFTTSFIPTEYGGAGFSMIDFALAAEELSRVDINVPTTLLGCGLGLQPVIQHGTRDQKERLLRPFVADKEGDLLASYAFTDVAGGANFDSPDPAGGMQTLARRDGDEWVITGQKHYTTNGTGWNKKGCQLYTVVCRTDSAAGAHESLAVIAVPGDVAGITVVDVYDTIGHRGVVNPRVHFDEVRVPVDNLIGQPGQHGKRIVASTFSWTAALIGAACVGRMRAAFDYALDFARTEKRLGTVPIIEHQNVGFMLADIKMRIEACRYLTWKACHDFERTRGLAEELAIMTKVYCSETAVKTVYDCMQVVGIVSYTRDQTPLDRIMRDTMCFPLYDGGNQGVRRRQLHEMFQQP